MPLDTLILVSSALTLNPSCHKWTFLHRLSYLENYLNGHYSDKNQNFQNNSPMQGWDGLYQGGAPGGRPPPPNFFSISCIFWENLVKWYVGAPWRIAGGNPGSTPAFPVPMNLPESALSSPCVHYPPFLCSHSHFTSLSSCLLLIFPVLSSR